MASGGEKIDGMTWWEYVQRHSGGAANTHIAQRVGITPSSVGRWNKGSGPDPTQAAAFARSYGRPVLEAFVAAGYLTPREAGEKPSAAPSLASLDDDELLEEIRQRMKNGGQTWAPGDTSPEDDQPGGDVVDLPWAARKGKLIPPADD